MSFALRRWRYDSVAVLLALCAACDSGSANLSVPRCDAIADTFARIDCYATEVRHRQIDEAIHRETIKEPGPVGELSAKKVAENAGAVKLCHGLRLPFEQAGCLALVAIGREDIVPCQEANEIFPTPSCLQEFAAGKCDPSLCSRIKLLEPREECLAAVVTKCNATPEACALMDPPRRNECILALVKADPSQSELCTKSSFSSACYRTAAVAHDPSICETVGTGPASRVRRACFDAAFKSALSSHRLGPAHCEAIHDPETADDCWFAVASDELRPGAADACLKILEPARRRHCARTYFPTARDIAVCLLLEGSALPSACERFVASIPAKNRK